MNQRHFSVLLLASLVLAVAIFLLVPGLTERDEISGDLFLRDVGGRINEVNRMVVTAGGGEVSSTLVKRDSGWTIRELDDYPVDWSRLRAVLAGLAEAVVVEQKTSNPEYYPHLGVEAVTEDGANNVLLELSLGDQVLGIIVGNDATSRGGQYVRLSGIAQSVLIDRGIDVSAEPLSWADDGIVDIGSALVAEIEISHPDGDMIRVRKVSADDTDFKLENLPEERKILSSWSINSLANTFSLLRMDAVKPDIGEPSGEIVFISLLMFSGIEVTAEAFEREGRGWIRLKASAPSLPDATGADEQAVQLARALVEEAESINGKVNGWVYRLPVSKFEAMTKRFEQLLEPLDDGGGV